MTIDKRINYAWGGPGGKSPGRGGPAGGATGGGGGGRDRDRPTPTRDRHPPAPRPAPAPVTTAKAPPSILSRPAPTTYKDPDPVTETVPGDVTFEPKKEIKSIGPSLHGGPTVKEALDKGALKKMIRDQALEKMDYIPDDLTQLDLNKFGETFEPVKPDLRTEKEKGEDWERAQDWDKIQKLSDRGHSSEEIQKAMEKGLLTKADPQSMRTNLLGRGLRSLRNIIPGTNLEESLLGRLKKGFTTTEGGLFDPKRMALGALKNIALKKLGLGALNPLLGIASLFGFDPFRGLMNKFAKKPAFDIEEASKLGLHANRFPTEGGQLPSNEEYAKDLTAKGPRAIDLTSQVAGEENVIAENIAKFTGQKTGVSSDVSPEFQGLVKHASLKDMSTLQIKDFKALDLRDKMEKSGIEIPDPLNNEEKQRLEKLRKLRESKVSGSTGPVMVAHGGRIDKPLTGRSRDI